MEDYRGLLPDFRNVDELISIDKSKILEIKLQINNWIEILSEVIRTDGFSDVSYRDFLLVNAILKNY